jgi:hypothetical protein
LDGDDDEIDSSRLPRVIVAALLSLAGLATVVWFGYERSVDRLGNEVVVIGPPPGPVRTRPDLPGGANQPYAGLKVYEPPQAPEAEAETSRLSRVNSGQTDLASANPTSGETLGTATPQVARKPIGQTAEYLQIGAYPTQQMAERAFRQFQTAHGDLAASLLPDIKRAELGEKGTWYRLRVGPFAGKGVATATCDKMKSEGVTFLLAAR